MKITQRNYPEPDDYKEEWTTWDIVQLTAICIFLAYVIYCIVTQTIHLLK